MNCPEQRLLCYEACLHEPGCMKGCDGFPCSDDKPTPKYPEEPGRGWSEAGSQGGWLSHPITWVALIAAGYWALGGLK